MNRFESVLLVVAVSLGFYIPMLALGFGLLSLLFENPKEFLNLFLIYGAIGFVVFVIYRLVEHPKTSRITQMLLWAVWITFAVHSCSNYSGGCASSRYIECE